MRWLAVYVAAYTGVRAGELWALPRRDVDLLRGVLHPCQTVKRYAAAPNAPPDTVDQHGRKVAPPKNGRPRSMSLPKHRREMLGEHFTAPRSRPAAPDPRTPCSSPRPGDPVNHTVFMRQVFRPRQRCCRPTSARSASTTYDTPAPACLSPHARTPSSYRNASGAPP